MDGREERLDLCNLCDRKSIRDTCPGKILSNLWLSRDSLKPRHRWPQQNFNLPRSGQRGFSCPLIVFKDLTWTCWITFLSEGEKRWCGRSRSSDPSSCPFVLCPLLQMDFSPNNRFLTPDEEGCLKMSPFVLRKRKQCRLGREKKLNGYSVFSSWEIAAALVGSFSNRKSANIHAMKEFNWFSFSTLCFAGSTQDH